MMRLDLLVLLPMLHLAATGWKATDVKAQQGVLADILTNVDVTGPGSLYTKSHSGESQAQFTCGCS